MEGLFMLASPSNTEALFVMALIVGLFALAIALTRWIFRVNVMIALLTDARQEIAQSARYLLDIGKYAHETSNHLQEIKILLDSIDRKSEEEKK